MENKIIIGVIIASVVYTALDATAIHYPGYYNPVNISRPSVYPSYQLFNYTYSRPNAHYPQWNTSRNSLWGRSFCMPDFYNCSGSHSLFAGCVTAWDKLIYRKEFVRPGHWWLAGREKYIYFPKDLPPGYNNQATITGIRVYDRNCNNQGGFAEIKYPGGPGYRNATMRLFSTGSGKGFNFLVEIFGK